MDSKKDWDLKRTWCSHQDPVSSFPFLELLLPSKTAWSHWLHSREDRELGVRLWGEACRQITGLVKPLWILGAFKCQQFECKMKSEQSLILGLLESRLWMENSWETILWQQAGPPSATFSVWIYGVCLLCFSSCGSPWCSEASIHDGAFLDHEPVPDALRNNIPCTFLWQKRLQNVLGEHSFQKKVILNFSPEVRERTQERDCNSLFLELSYRG